MISNAKFVIIWTWLAIQTNGWNKFCSVMCPLNQCNSEAHGDCTSNFCQNPWTWNATLNTCDISLFSGWTIVNTSTDCTGCLGGITSNITSTATCGSITGGSNWGYTFIGNLSDSSVLLYTDSTGPQVPFYQIRVIFWVILIDNWQNSDQIKVTLSNNISLVQTILRSSRQTA